MDNNSKFILYDKFNKKLLKEVNFEVFIPQFKLIVCTNTLFDIESNDDGTWRRIRVVEHLSKFTDNPYNDSRFPKEEYPYQFPVDRKIDEITNYSRDYKYIKIL